MQSCPSHSKDNLKCLPSARVYPLFLSARILLVTARNGMQVHSGIWKQLSYLAAQSGKVYGWRLQILPKQETLQASKQAPLAEGLQNLCLPLAARSAASASREPSRLEIRELANSSSTRNNYLPLFSSIAHAPNMLRLGLVQSMQTFHHFIYRSTKIPLVALLLFFLFLVVLILVLTQLLMRNAMDTACK